MVQSALECVGCDQFRSVLDNVGANQFQSSLECVGSYKFQSALECVGGYKFQSAWECVGGYKFQSALVCVGASISFKMRRLWPISIGSSKKNLATPQNFWLVFRVSPFFKNVLHNRNGWKLFRWENSTNSWFFHESLRSENFWNPY